MHQKLGHTCSKKPQSGQTDHFGKFPLMQHSQRGLYHWEESPKMYVCIKKYYTLHIKSMLDISYKSNGINYIYNI